MDSDRKLAEAEEDLSPEELSECEAEVTRALWPLVLVGMAICFAPLVPGVEQVARAPWWAVVALVGLVAVVWRALCNREEALRASHRRPDRTFSLLLGVLFLGLGLVLTWLRLHLDAVGMRITEWSFEWSFPVSVAVVFLLLWLRFRVPGGGQSRGGDAGR